MKEDDQNKNQMANDTYIEQLLEKVGSKSDEITKLNGTVTQMKQMVAKKDAQIKHFKSNIEQEREMQNVVHNLER